MEETHQSKDAFHPRGSGNLEEVLPSLHQKLCKCRLLPPEACCEQGPPVPTWLKAEFGPGLKASQAAKRQDCVVGPGKTRTSGSSDPPILDPAQ